MNEIAIVVNYDNEKPTVSGRELHKALQIETPYKKWFDRMTMLYFTINLTSTGERLFTLCVRTQCVLRRQNPCLSAIAPEHRIQQKCG